MQIPLVDLKAQYAAIKPAIDKAYAQSLPVAPPAPDADPALEPEPLFVPEPLVPPFCARRGEERTPPSFRLCR